MTNHRPATSRPFLTAPVYQISKSLTMKLAIAIAIGTLPLSAKLDTWAVGAVHHHGCNGDLDMTRMTATAARKQLYRLVDEVADSHEPIQIAGKRSSAVLVSEEDWRAIQETLYLTSIRGMHESIRKGLKTPIEKCQEGPGW
jgi:antitoxin YefM